MLTYPVDTATCPSLAGNPWCVLIHVIIAVMVILVHHQVVSTRSDVMSVT